MSYEAMGVLIWGAYDARNHGKTNKVKEYHNE